MAVIYTLTQLASYAAHERDPLDIVCVISYKFTISNEHLHE